MTVITSIEVKNKNFRGGRIEDQFAQLFPYRSQSSLQVHYCTKLKKLKDRMKHLHQ